MPYNTEPQTSLLGLQGQETPSPLGLSKGRSDIEEFKREHGTALGFQQALKMMGLFPEGQETMAESLTRRGDEAAIREKRDYELLKVRRGLVTPSLERMNFFLSGPGRVRLMGMSLEEQKRYIRNVLPGAPDPLVEALLPREGMTTPELSQEVQDRLSPVDKQIYNRAKRADNLSKIQDISDKYVKIIRDEKKKAEPSPREWASIVGSTRRDVEKEMRNLHTDKNTRMFKPGMTEEKFRDEVNVNTRARLLNMGFAPHLKKIEKARFLKPADLKKRVGEIAAFIKASTRDVSVETARRMLRQADIAHGQLADAGIMLMKMVRRTPPPKEVPSVFERLGKWFPPSTPFPEGKTPSPELGGL
jgi:hypothetical protein